MNIVELIDKLEIFYRDFGYGFIFISSLIESSPMGWVTPGGFILAVGGFFAFNKSLSLSLVILFGFLGTWTTLCVGYVIGKKTGLNFAKKLKQEKRVEKAKRVINRYGRLILSTSLLSNVTRFWISYAAGVLNYNIKKFTFYSVVASLTWTCLWTIAGYLAGEERVSIEKALTKFQFIAWIILAVAVLSIYVSLKNDYQDFK